MTNTNPLDDKAAWHALSQVEVVKRLATNSENGLDLSDASARLQQYGPNRLPEGRKRGPFTRFFAQFNNILVYVLLAARFTKLMLSLWIDAGIIFAVVFLNALLGFIQEGKAEKALDSRSRTHRRGTVNRRLLFRSPWKPAGKEGRPKSGWLDLRSPP